MQKTKKSKLDKIDSEDFNFSHVGDASEQKFLYLLDKKKNIDDFFENKKVKQKKVEPQDFWHEKEKDIYDDLYEKDEYEDDIFDKEYDRKYKKELKERRQKFAPPKNACAIIDEDTELEQKKNKKKKKEDKSESEKKENKKVKEENLAKKRAAIEKKLLYGMVNERYKYHLLHHHHDQFMDKSLLNLNEQVSSSSYKPKLDFIFKKLVYSREFDKISGRYDQELKKGLNDNKKEKIMKTQKEKEYASYQKKLKRIRNSNIIPNKVITENEFDEEKELKRDRYKSISENIRLIKNNSGNIIFKRNSSIQPDNESRNFNKKIYRRNNSVLMNDNKFIVFGLKNSQSKKSSFANMNNLEELNEGNYLGEEKKNSSNNLEENTLSSLNHNKTTSAKKKISNYDTEVIYPNVSKNDSNIILNNNSSNRKSFKHGYNTLISLNNLINLRQNEYTTSNISSKFQNVNKQFNNNSNNNSNVSSAKRKHLSLNKVVNFEKMLSRDYFNKLNEQESNIHSSISPNYESIRPKCIMKVIYARKYYKKNRTKEFKSDYNEIVFDIDKSYNQYNNHFPPKSIYLGKMTGRKIDKTLPSYMMDQYNRNSYNTVNDKSLKMNNFANGELLEQKSSFNQKRTFNYKLNDQYTGNDPYALDRELDSVFRKVTKYPISYKKKSYGELKSLSCPDNESQSNRYTNFMNQIIMKPKLPEYYQVNLDKFGKYPFSCGEKIDGFTLKTIKSSKSSLDLLSEHEKRIFLSNLDS